MQSVEFKTSKFAELRQTLEGDCLNKLFSGIVSIKLFSMKNSSELLLIISLPALSFAAHAEIASTVYNSKGEGESGINEIKHTNYSNSRRHNTFVQ